MDLETLIEIAKKALDTHGNIPVVSGLTNSVKGIKATGVSVMDAYEFAPHFGYVNRTKVFDIVLGGDEVCARKLPYA